jgi:signal transduction histidine kinase
VIANRAPRRVEARIIDDGPGIPPAIQGRTFDPFFTTKGVGEGIGLGLDIVRRLGKQHEGEIEVESRPGSTKFCRRGRRTHPPVARASAQRNARDRGRGKRRSRLGPGGLDPGRAGGSGSRHRVPGVRVMQQRRMRTLRSRSRRLGGTSTFGVMS